MFGSAAVGRGWRWCTGSLPAAAASRPTAGGCHAPHQTPPSEQPVPSPHELNTQCKHLTPLLTLALVGPNSILLSWLTCVCKRHIQKCFLVVLREYHGLSYKFLDVLGQKCEVSNDPDAHPEFHQLVPGKKQAQMHPNISFSFSYKSLDFE